VTQPDKCPQCKSELLHPEPVCQDCGASTEGDAFVTHGYNVYIPTFPDTGEKVKPHELGTWLKMIEDDPDIGEEPKKVARALVHRIRAQSN
jgi:hypothetical protein